VAKKGLTQLFDEWESEGAKKEEPKAAKRKKK
jgi:hypothetical protein